MYHFGSKSCSNLPYHTCHGVLCIATPNKFCPSLASSLHKWTYWVCHPFIVSELALCVSSRGENDCCVLVKMWYRVVCIHRLPIYLPSPATAIIMVSMSSRNFWWATMPIQWLYTKQNVVWLLQSHTLTTCSPDPCRRVQPEIWSGLSHYVTCSMLNGYSIVVILAHINWLQYSCHIGPYKLATV